MIIQPLQIIGISCRTTNENGQSSVDIPALWHRFMAGQIADMIPGKTSPDIYCLYTDYERDHTRPYTTIIGCRVNSLNVIPKGLTGLAIESGDYNVETVKGNISEGLVFNAWVKIWNSGMARAFRTDFEVYGQKAIDLENAVVEIFISV